MGGGNEKDRIKNVNDRHVNGNGGRTGMAEQECVATAHKLLSGYVVARLG